MTTEKRQDDELLSLLRDYPAPKADPGFYERALAKAALAGHRRQRRNWMATGFGSAVAAGIAAWLVFGLLTTAPELPEAKPELPGVSVALAEPRTINLVFASKTALDDALLTVTLPEGVELSGFPGQREITWETSLVEGRNLLPLTLVATSSAGGEVYARLRHGERNKDFRLLITVDDESASSEIIMDRTTAVG